MPATFLQVTTPSLAAARARAQALLLPSGKVLAVGGDGGASMLASAELYDPNPASPTFGWSSAGNLAQARVVDFLGLLGNGKVLAVGGYNSANSTSYTNVDVYDPSTNAWTAGPSLAVGVSFGQGCMLPNGDAFYCGGFDTAFAVHANAYIYRAATGVLEAQPAMPTGGTYSGWCLPISSHEVLVAMGSNPAFAANGSSWIYDFIAKTWSTGPGVAAFLNNPVLGGQAGALADGRFLLVGSVSTGHHVGVVFDPRSRTFSRITAGEVQAVINASANWVNVGYARLPSGRLLMADPRTGSGAPIAGATAVYDPALNTYVAVGDVNLPTTYWPAVVLPSGRVLKVGGYTGTFASPTAVCETFDEPSNTWGYTAANGTSVGVPEKLPTGGAEVQVDGTFAATLQLQGSIPGDVYVAQGSGITAPGFAAVGGTSAPLGWLRASITAFTSGAPRASF